MLLLMMKKYWCTDIVVVSVRDRGTSWYLFSSTSRNSLRDRKKNPYWKKEEWMPFPWIIDRKMTLMIMMVSLCLPEVIAGHILLDFYADDAFITRRERGGKRARGVSLSLHLHSIHSIWLISSSFSSSILEKRKDRMYHRFSYSGWSFFGCLCHFVLLEADKKYSSLSRRHLPSSHVLNTSPDVDLFSCLCN